jgi:hypothetical protein
MRSLAMIQFAAALVAGVTIFGTLGCARGTGRQIHTDPFGTPRQARVTGAEVVAKPHRSKSRTEPSEVIQAGFDDSQSAGPPASNAPGRERATRNQPPQHDESNLLDDPNDLISTADASRQPSAESSSRSGHETSLRAETEPPRRSGTNGTQAQDHAPDYSWIQGTLEYSAFGGGTWRVRYAQHSADDAHGGSVTLDSALDPERFAPGDTVFVEGQIVDGAERRNTTSPLYRVRQLRHL